MIGLLRGRSPFLKWATFSIRENENAEKSLRSHFPHSHFRLFKDDTDRKPNVFERAAAVGSELSSIFYKGGVVVELKSPDGEMAVDLDIQTAAAGESKI